MFEFLLFHISNKKIAGVGSPVLTLMVKWKAALVRCGWYELFGSKNIGRHRARSLVTSAKSHGF